VAQLYDIYMMMMMMNFTVRDMNMQNKLQLHKPKANLKLYQ